MRVFLDTNVLASAVATRGICEDVLKAALTEHEVVVSEQVLAELGRALREKFRTPEDLISATDEWLRREAAEIVSDAPRLEVRVRDDDDQGILEQAVGGGADVLITGDRDLTDIAGRCPVRILTPRGFWELLRSDVRETE